MRIGLTIMLHGGPPEGERDAPRWARIREQARAAEEAGFDIVVIEDGTMYRDEDERIGWWESVSMAGALAAATERIDIGHSVLNGPYRPPTLVANIADTLDEISGGRYVLGIGRGNTEEVDYAAVGVAADHRTARLAEALPVIRGLLKDGRVDLAGEYWSAHDAELVMRGPRPQGPPIVVAAAGPKMLRLTARYADGWNWWTTTGTDVSQLRPIVDELERACDETGRDPATLQRSLDVYSVDPLGRFPDANLLSGSPDELADAILSFGELGFDEIRCDLHHPPSDGSVLREAIPAMAGVVERVHAAATG